MSDQVKEETKKKKQSTGFGWWLFRKRRPIIKSWATAWKDPEFRKAIKAHNESVARKKGT